MTVDRVWTAEVRDIVGGDLVATLATWTPGGGVSLVPVCPFGVHDPDAGTVGMTSPLALTRKFARVRRHPHIALAFFTRDHGHGTAPGFLLLQGDAVVADRVESERTAAFLAQHDRFLHPAGTGRVTRWLNREYLEQRVEVVVHAERLTRWTTGDVVAPGTPPQQPPSTPASVSRRTWRSRLGKARHVMLGYLGDDGYPVVLPVSAMGVGDVIHVSGAVLPPGARRATLFGMWFEQRLEGQGAIEVAGWLEVGNGGAAVLTPRRAAGFDLPRSRFSPRLLVPLGVKFVHRRAVRRGHVAGDHWVG